MKSNLIKTILIGLTVIISSVLLIPRIIVNHYWKKIDDFNKVERYQTALDYAVKAKSFAKTWHLKPAYVKSLLYEVKCKASLHSDLLEITNLLRTEKKSNPSPIKEIITSLYLEKLWDNYFRHQRRYDNKTYLDEGDDIGSWSNKRILREIITNIYAIHNAQNLMSYSFSSYQKQICSSSGNQIRFNTLYEFLTWHSIELLNWSNRFFYEDYVVRNQSDQFFVPLKDFLKQPIATNDTFDLYTNSMAFYQDLLKFESANFNHKLTYEIELQRLNNLREKNQSDNADQKFLSIIEGYRKSVKYKEVQLLMDYALFNEYKAQGKDNEYKRKCLEIIKNYPEYKSEVKECKKIMNELSQKYISFYTSNIFSLEQPVEIKINAQNTDTVYCNLYKLPDSYNLVHNLKINTNSDYKLLIGKCIDKQTIVFNHEFSIMQTKSQSFCNLGNGAYLIVIGYKNNLNDYKNVKEWQIVKVTSIGGYSFGDFDKKEIYAVKRKNGEPIKKASIIIYSNKGAKQTFLTDESGKVRVQDSLFSNQLIIGYKGDTIALTDRYFNSYNYDRDEETIHIQLFTDRAVYRPSQKIYFKGILNQKDLETRKYFILANQKVHLSFKNYSFTYGEQDLITNEFGSFSGSFQIPAKVSLGQMQIETEYGEHYVQIEEYKPTKMRLSVLPYQQPTSIGDSVVITGYTKYLNGMPARNLPVTYNIRCAIHNREHFLGSSTITGTAYSDQLGQYKIRLKTKQSPNDRLNQYEYDYSFNVECKDEFGEIQSETCQVSVGFNSCQANIKIDEFLLKKPNIKIPVEFNYNDNPVNAQKCRLTIYKLQTKPQKLEKQTYDQIYNDISDVKFDSLQRNKIVVDKTLVNLLSYEFDASSLNKEEPGFYVAEISATVNNKINILQHSYFTLLENVSAKLNLNVAHFFIPLTTETKPGETVSFIAGSTLSDVYGLFTLTKHHQILVRKWIHLSKNQQIINIPVKETYRGGFQASFVCFADNRAYDKSHLIKVPFDNKKLHISFNSFRNNLYPGQQETWNLKIKDNDGNPANAEMVATLYDEALDEISPNYYSYFPYSNFEEDEYSNGSWEFLYNNDITGYGLITNLADIKIDRPIEGYGYGNFFPTFNWNLDNKNRGRATYFYRNRRGRDFACNKCDINSTKINFSNLASINAEVPPPPMRSTVKFTPPELNDAMVEEELTGKVNHPDMTGSITKLRKDFRETAFFIPNTKADTNGSVTFNFTMPDALTRWKMLGFAHTQDMKTGSITNKLVTQKDFMVIPNWPRFFRSGDTVSFNVRIENNVVKNTSGIISLEIQDVSRHKPFTNKIIESGIIQKFTIKGKMNTFASWKLVIPQNISTLKFRVIAKSGNSEDGEEMLLPVLPNEVLITESMPFFLPDKEPKIFRFDNFKKQNFNNIRNYQYVFEIDPNPKWNVISALGYLADYPYECAEQTFNKYFGYCLAEYISKHNPSINQFFNKKGKIEADELKSSLETNPDLKSCLLEESPWLFEAKTMSEKIQNLSKCFNYQSIEDKKSELSDKIQSFQNPDGGIAWFKGMESNEFISFYFLEAIGKMNKLGILNSFNEEHPNFLNSLVRYCDMSLYKWYLDHKNKTNILYWDGYLLTSYAYCRSYLLKEFPISKDKQEAYNLQLKQMKTQWQKANRSQKPLIALILFRNREYMVANQIIESLKEQAITDPNKGMYWEFNNNNYSFSFSPIENQSTILELFIETHQKQIDIDNIKNWLYLHKKNNYWYSTISTAKACYSLLLNEPKWYTSSSFRVDVGSYSFTTANTTANPSGGFRKSWNAAQVSNTMGDVKIKPLNNEKVPTWGSAYWQYFTRMDKITETTSGVWIRKLYFIKKNNEYKQITAHESVKVGDEVLVRLDFGSDNAISYIHIKDLRPTSLEPMDKTSGYQWQNGLGFFESIRDVSQNFFIENLPKGKHLIEYRVRVTHQGCFQTGNASIQCMYAPEYIGNSRSTILKVQ